MLKNFHFWQMKRAKNPILRGFNPDPSVIRVGDDYYVATSTFEWFPGVQIHHSRDLCNWQLISRPLSRVSQLDMIGNPDSCGVWAPCLSYDQGIFHLIYTNVRLFDGPWKDTPNYLVTTEDIRGEWSEPIYLNSSGFDPSLFHDEDGRKWFVNMIVDHRGSKLFGGVVLQEYDPAAKKLAGPIHYIFEGTELGCTEAPHLYKKDGYYYLILAEGGTEYNHAITIARSRSITGPYEVHPDNPLITASHNPEAPLQKAGHGDIVETQSGDWYAFFLVGRPLTQRGRCITGRETAIEQIIWEKNGWPYSATGEKAPRLEVPVPGLPAFPFPAEPVRDDFDHQELNIHFQALRIPIEENWASLLERPGYLRLYGRDSLSSFHHQSLLARRVQHFHIEAETCLEFEPQSFQQMAGLVCYYNTSHWYYLHVAGDEKGRKLLQIISCDKHQVAEPLSSPIDLTEYGKIYLKVDFNGAALQFYYGTTPDEWQKAGPVMDGSILSDDYVMSEGERYRPAFTGAFVGLCCQDLSGRGSHADFDWLVYREL